MTDDTPTWVRELEREDQEDDDRDRDRQFTTQPKDEDTE